jgi:hypothetical protein
MNPATHFFIGWLTANTADLSRRDRAIVTAASVAPDLDGLGLVADLFGDHRYGYYWYGEYHHVLCHNLLFGVLIAGAALLAARRRWTAALLCLVVFHLHLLGDLIGARGPDGSQWPIPYLWPFSDRLQLTWSGQWLLNAWPNVVITVLAMALTGYLTWRRGFSPVEIVSPRADRAVVRTLRARFGEPKRGDSARKDDKKG